MSEGQKPNRGRSPATTLSESQQRILDFIRAYNNQHGYSPSLAEIGRGVHRVYGSVREQVLRLERMGYITRTPYVARSLILTEKARSAKP